MVFYLNLLYNNFRIISRKYGEKMKKNNQGFVLVETLVVTVFVMAVFSVIYINFYPIAGEYERREFYDDIDSKYGAYWMKRFIQGNSYNFFGSNSPSTRIENNTYEIFECSSLSDAQDVALCNEMRNRLDISKVVITKYRLTEFKNTIQSNPNIIGDNFSSYIEYLPEYTTASLNGANYRVLVQYEKTFETAGVEENYYTYATMEVVKYEN